jgi:signal transduction histidine kinase
MVATGEFGHKLIGTHVSTSQSVAGWVTSHSQPLIVNDPGSDPRFTGDVDRMSGFQTMNAICVPLIVHNRTIGAMQVLNRQGGFGPQDLEWLASVSGQIAIAVENARLYSREHEKVKELASLNKVSQTITSELDVREVIGSITDSVLEILAVERSELFLINQQMQQLELYSATGAEIDSQWSQKPIPLDEGLVGLCAEQKHALIVNRVGDDPRCAGIFAEPEMARSSLALVPLLSRGATIGVIVVYSVLGHLFDDERMILLQTFANQAAVALENATLYQSVQREQERIITIQEDVRHRLARDLHDGPAQMLSSIIMSAGLTRRHVQREQDEAVLDELKRLEEIARQANQEVRTLLFELRPIILESQGLVPAIHAYYRQLVGTLSSRVHLEVAPFSETFSPLAADSIFAIIQESVNNIRKHAQAQNIWIRIYIEESNLIFEMEDDGVGLDLAQLNKEYSQRNSYGLLNMRERAALFGGRLVIRSPRSTGQSGTVIVGTLPLRTILGEPNPNFSLI